jgi:hypothetical protein
MGVSNADGIDGGGVAGEPPLSKGVMVTPHGRRWDRQAAEQVLAAARSGKSGALLVRVSRQVLHHSGVPVLVAHVPRDRARVSHDTHAEAWIHQEGGPEMSCEPTRDPETPSRAERESPDA